MPLVRNHNNSKHINVSLYLVNIYVQVIAMYKVLVGRIYKFCSFDIVADEGPRQLHGAGCAVESLVQLCGAEQCVLVDTAERSAGCGLQMLLPGGARMMLGSRAW